ncbi:hypothetical protein, partial [Helicobacter pylori]|uniref:hypothetical protein n=1 Tax=Helicobacter pylori TaxID=210 RepID=UPI001A7E081A
FNQFANKSVGIITIFQKFTIKLNKYGRKKRLFLSVFNPIVKSCVIQPAINKKVCHAPFF